MDDIVELLQIEEVIFEEDVSKQKMRPKLFISYSHLDNTVEKLYIKEFHKYIVPLESMGLIDIWYDRSVLAGEEYQSEIDYNLEDADIICLFISANSLSSESCIGEKKKALELRKKRGVSVVPIILSPCWWKDDGDISKLLALPTDGQPVSGFAEREVAWQNIYDELRKVAEKELKIIQLKVDEEFKQFLNDAELLKNAHPKKENVALKDVYISTVLDEYDSLKEHKGTRNSEDLLTSLLNYEKIIIAGEAQSGKTTLCKRIFYDLRCLNFVPVYVSDKNVSSPGNLENTISKLLHEQYSDFDEVRIDAQRIVPIVDDFHRVKNKERHIKSLRKYTYSVIVVDDIFSLNIKDETLISSFTTFRIKELKPSQISELVKKWVGLTDKHVEGDYKDIDKKTDLIFTTLGRNIGKGILPAYPFFILSTIVTYETFSLSLEQDITSQGYCYQAFIYYYLRKRNVSNDEIDTYVNFLTELASYMYREKWEELNSNSFATFMEFYLKKYYLPIEQEVLLINLSEIVSHDSFNNYSFKYPCFYYFFVAKSLSEHLGDMNGMEEIRNILNNLHVDEYAYIAVFLTHHSRNTKIFDEIEKIALSLFDKYNPATLIKGEMKFFDEQAHNIVDVALPPANVTPEMERAKRLKDQDEFEQSHLDVSQEQHLDEDTFAQDLRKAVKTVEVMGCIIRNRAGSLEKVRIRNILMNGMNVHLRVLSSFFELLKSETELEEIVDYISNRLSHLEERKGQNQKLSEGKKRKLAKIIFWNSNFLIMYGIIYKIVRSLGSDKLTEITIDVCDEISNPASFLIMHGILMEYSKNLQVKELEKGLHRSDFSKVAKNALKLMVVNHCSLHAVSYRDKKRIADRLDIPECLEVRPNTLLPKIVDQT